MQTLIDLLVCLHRHESTARAAARQMSPRERCLLETQIALVRDAIPKRVLDRYDRVKRREPVLEQCPAAMAMATLVSVCRTLPTQKRRNLNSFFELTGGSSRN